MEYLEVTVATASEGIELVGANLTAAGFDSFVIEDQAEFEDFLEGNQAYWDYIDESLQEHLQGLSQIRLFFEVDGTEQTQLTRLEQAVAELRQRLPRELVGSLDLTVSKTADLDWEESWKENYPPQPVGQKLIVLPYWNAEETQGRIPVILDPGLTFGTGAHPSTQMCMELMEQVVQPGCQAIDLGSGSGILSIAALRLGAGHATGVDIDPKAEDIARENAAYNGFDAGCFTALTGNVCQDQAMMERLAAQPYDLVLVNIVADVIIGLAPVLTRLMKPEATVILSGILDVREAEVIRTLEANGLKIVEGRAKEEWRCLRAVRRD